MSIELDQIYHKRLYQLVVFTEIAVIVIGVKSFYEGANYDGLILMLAAALNAGVFYLIRQQRHQLASFVFLAVITGLLLLIQWTVSGIKDNSQLGLAGVLVFAALIGARRLFSVLLLLLMVHILLMGYAFEQGVSFRPPKLNLSSAINITIILGIVGIAIRILVRDNLTLLNQLRQKVDAVNNARAAVEHQAKHDFLTGLPNRILAAERFSQVLNRLSRHPERKAGLLYIDFDEFKDINDTLGHSIGDRFLQAKAKQLSQCLRSTDLVCRIGGDEFLIFVEDTSPEQLNELANKLLAAVQKEEVILGHNLHCTSSIGIVSLPEDAATYDLAVKRADIAMYRAKHGGKNQYHYYDKSLEQDVRRRYQLQKSLSPSLEKGDFHIALQPIIELATDRVIGAEALARWNHPELGQIPPDEFIPIAEASHQIEAIFAMVLKSACVELKRIMQLQPDFYISINVSPLQLNQSHFFKRFSTTLAEYGLSGRQIKLEVTESQILEPTSELRNNLDDLHEHQIGLYLDDFGTGFSNLNQLQKMAFEIIKIDRSFIQQCHQSDSKQTLLKSITAMATQLDVRVVAEGVEYEEERNQLRQLGVGFGQGYFWSQPITTEAFYQQFFAADT